MAKQDPHPPYRAPHRALLWSEYLRAGAETAAYVAALPLLTGGTPGDGHRVLVLPGLLADDRSTVGLRHVLRLRGYRAHGWRLGTNIGPTRVIRDGLLERLDALSEGGKEPVSIIGWSLGGILARELGRRYPEKVRGVITLGSPFRLSIEDSPDATHPGRIFHAFRPWHTDMIDYVQGEDQRPPIMVPTTSIYSRLDGVVPWQACVDLDGPLRESVEVTGSHLGMGMNPHVLAIVLDRLAQPSGQWQRYGARSEVAA
jgi:hypothetical protein